VKAGLDRAGSFNPYDPRPPFRRAQQAIARGDLATARHELEPIVRANPRNAPAQQLLGQVLFQSSDRTAALEHYDRMFDLFPGDLAVAVNRGLLASAASDFTKAIPSFERAVALSPGKIVLRAQLATAFAGKGQTARALTEYDAFLNAYEAAPKLDELEYFLSASLHSAELLISTGADDRAMERLQHTADVAATHHRFSQASTALTLLADLQQKHGRPIAAQTRELAARAQRFERDSTREETAR
jgi:tetratricopeptide (TPR) repeat protein